MFVVLERRGKGGGEREGARTKKRTRERMYLSPIQRMKFKQVACVCASVCACVRACVRAREQVRTCVLRTRTNTHCVSARCVCAHTCKCERALPRVCALPFAREQVLFLSLTSHLDLEKSLAIAHENCVYHNYIVVS